MQPSLEKQSRHWGELAEDRPIHGGDRFADRIAEIARDCAERCNKGRLVEVGCGTGWLTRHLAPMFGAVYGTDLAQGAIDVARSKHPAGTYVAGDFNTMPLPEPADMVVSVEVVAHVAEQRLFFERLRAVTNLGGRLLLFTQNPRVWHNTRNLVHAPGRLRRWPTIREVRTHLGAVGFRVVSAQTIQPGGDWRWLFWFPKAHGALKRAIGLERTELLFERLWFGRTMVLEAVAV